MEYVTYLQAAEILNRPYNSIKQAVSRGSLTRCSTPAKPAYLLKEQVMLFADKNRIAITALTAENQTKWQKYQKIAQGSPVVDNDQLTNIASVLADTTKNLGSVLGDLLFNAQLERGLL
jgi:hypothetical protein